jgi:hypothetical protein
LKRPLAQIYLFGRLGCYPGSDGRSQTAVWTLKVVRVDWLLKLSVNELLMRLDMLDGFDCDQVENVVGVVQPCWYYMPNPPPSGRFEPSARLPRCCKPVNTPCKSERGEE